MRAACVQQHDDSLGSEQFPVAVYQVVFALVSFPAAWVEIVVLTHGLLLKREMGEAKVLHSHVYLLQGCI